jgi:hypothetical protein
MKLLSLLVLFALAMSSFALAGISVNSVKMYNPMGLQVNRTYLADEDTLVVDVTTTRLMSQLNLMLSPNGGGAGCRRLSNTHYSCTYTDSMYGPKGMRGFYMNGTYYDTGEQNSTPVFKEIYLNPGPYNVTLNAPIAFGTLLPGTIVYSSNVTASITKEDGADGRIYIQGKPTYSSTGQSKCPYSNVFATANIEYRISGGVLWQKLSAMPKPIGVNSVTLQFRAKVPSYCVGTFDLAKSIIFSSAVVQ